VAMTVDAKKGVGRRTLLGVESFSSISLLLTYSNTLHIDGI